MSPGYVCLTWYDHVLSRTDTTFNQGFNFVNILCPGLCALDIFVRRFAQILFVAIPFQTIPLSFDFSMILVMRCQPFVGQLWYDKLFHAKANTKRPPYVAVIDSPMLLPRHACEHISSAHLHFWSGLCFYPSLFCVTLLHVDGATMSNACIASLIPLRI